MMNELAVTDPVQHEVDSIQRISAVPTILRAINATTGLRWSAIARAIDNRWVACAVHDELNLGLLPGSTLDVTNTLCSVVRETGAPVVIEHASEHPVYKSSPIPKAFGFESYIEVPIVLRDGSFYGTICAFDPLPAPINQAKVIEQVQLFAQLVAVQLDMETRELATTVARNRFESFVMGAPAAIAIMRGPTLAFELVNAGFHELVDSPVTIGQPAREALGLTASSTMWKMLETAYTVGENTSTVDHLSELKHRRAVLDDEVYLDVAIQPTLGADGRRDGVMLYINDVTDRVWARLRLEEKNRELDNFAYVASHDLKTPLRGIGNLVQWVQADEAETISDTSRSHLDLIQRRITHMNALIEGILEFARAGDEDKALVDVPVGPLLEEIVGLVAAPAGVTIDIGEHMPTLRASRVALMQVFLNLISNAVKHAARIDTKVVVSAKERTDRWMFSVSDNGPGIAPEHHQRVWKLFQSLKNNADSDSTGIGLSIVRKIVEARRGKVWIESIPGAGATFWFTWPKTARAPAAYPA